MSTITMMPWLKKGQKRMRVRSRKQVVVRDVMIGGERPLVCMSLLAKQKNELLSQLAKIISAEPDLIEWRIDCFELLDDLDACLDCLQEIRGRIGETPLVFTFRCQQEGGQSSLSEDRRLELIKGAMLTGDIDIVDIEMCNEPSFIASILEIKRQTSCKLIFSYHNFSATPTEKFIVDKLVQAEAMGGDIAKLAVMPKDNAEVLTLLSATNRARTSLVKIPIVTMSMGGIGAITRLAGGLFGSDITFAMGEVSSAPGQLPIAEVRRVMDILY